MSGVLIRCLCVYAEMHEGLIRLLAELVDTVLRVPRLRLLAFAPVSLALHFF